MASPAPPDPAPNATLRAAIWMLGAVGAFSLMAIAGRAVSADLDTFEIMFYRSLIGFAVVLICATALRTLRQVSWRRIDLHLGRNIFHFTGQNLWFYAITVIPLAQVFALEFTSPLWVLLLSPLFLDEKLTRLRILAAITGFIGILIVTRPAPDTLNSGTLTAALAAIGFAATLIYTKHLTRLVSLTCILFWMTLLQAVFGIIAAGFDGDMALPSATTLPWLTVIACCGLGAHYCLTKALTIAPATLVVPVDFLRLPIIALLGFVIYREPLDVFVILGAALIFGSNYVNLYAETKMQA